MQNFLSGNGMHSPARQLAIQCPHAPFCGACQLIQLPYEQQLERKDERMASLYGHLFAKSGETSVLRPIKGMDDPFYYRNKLISPYAPGRKLSSKQAKTAQRTKTKARCSKKAKPRYEVLCGMYAAGTHRLVNTEHCLIENREAKRVVLAVGQLMQRFDIAPYSEDAGSGFMRHVVVRVGHTSAEMLVTLVTNSSAFPSSRSFCRELVRRCPAITTVVQNVNERRTNVILGEAERTLYGPGFILDKLCGLSFRISSKSFYQVNATQTEVLYNTAIDLAELSGSEQVLDAYCGTGTIGLVAAKRGAASVVGVDSVASAIDDARQNARHNGIQNASFVVADAGLFMRKRAALDSRVDVVFMDPPRAGASKAFLETLISLGPARVVYISCDPQTQVRDLDHLTAQGYVLTKLQPLDMFPHTNHIESVAVLHRARFK